MTSAIVPPRSRLKREECRRTKHDSAFSPWKVLIGPSDWEAHATGKEGAERYRTENLPNCTSCTGVYELGVAVWHRRNGRNSGCKLDPDFIIPVYLGKADNVRNRMQQYGREGAHLENGNSNGRFIESNNKISAQTGLGLFREIFSKGFSIVYRWAPMEITRDAEKTESDLLDKFDYAWNKGSNGTRRRDDILKKLDRVSKTYPFLAKLQLFPQKRKGIKINVYKAPSLENGLDFYSNLEADGLHHRIFKFGRSQPRLVVRSGMVENYTSICGVALGHGVICKKPPTEGNKRCAEHKGMRVNGFTTGKTTLIGDETPNNEDSTPACGVILDDGSSCTSAPHQGNKRCLEHKGRKICSSIPPQMKDKKIDYGHISPSGVICGVELNDGTFCTGKPPAGRKRCEEHKGMRIKKTISTSSREEIPSRKEGENGSFIPSVFVEKSSPTCGAALQNGSFCSRKPTEGNKRCWHHYGMKVNSNLGSCNNKDIYGLSSSTCGAPLRNGSSYCRRRVTGGRCWQHGG